MSNVKRFTYVHRDGLQTKCNGFLIPAADDGGLVVNEVLPELASMVDAGILLCESSVVDAEENPVQPASDTQEETKDSELTGSDTEETEAEEAQDEPVAEESANDASAEEEEATDTAETESEPEVETSEEPDAAELGLEVPDAVVRMSMAGLKELSFADLKTYAAEFDITGRSIDAIISKLEEEGHTE